MKIIDFIFDGVKLSSMGFIISHISSEIQMGTVSLGNTASMTEVKAVHSDIRYSASYQYDDIIVLPDFDITKISCSNGFADINISDVEARNITRWLSRPEYKVLRLVYEDGEFSEVYYKGFFNLSPIYIGSNLVGFTLSFRTNAPYAFEDSQYWEFPVSNESPKLEIEDTSDRYGINYCDKMVITCIESGDITIENKNDLSNTIIIKNCTKGEVITLYGMTKVIDSSNLTHTTLASDFNYSFPRFKNSYYEHLNTFTCSNNCIISITYTPIRKVGGIIC